MSKPRVLILFAFLAMLLTVLACGEEDTGQDTELNSNNGSNQISTCDGTKYLEYDETQGRDDVSEDGGRICDYTAVFTNTHSDTPIRVIVYKWDEDSTQDLAAGSWLDLGSFKSGQSVEYFQHTATAPASTGNEANASEGPNILLHILKMVVGIYDTPECSDLFTNEIFFEDAAYGIPSTLCTSNGGSPASLSFTSALEPDHGKNLNEPGLLPIVSQLSCK